MGRSGARGVLARVLLLFAGLLAAEALSLAIFWGASGRPFSWRERQALRGAVISAADTATTGIPEGGQLVLNQRLREVLHPYLGYVVDPSTLRGVSRHGFRGGGEDPPVTRASDQAVVVGIFGGSFAGGTAARSGELLLDELRKIPAFRGRKLLLNTIAWGGYKQPQQLQALSYFLSLGASFDVVVNLDGFNEVALPEPENTSRQVFPFFPSRWALRVSSFSDPDKLKLLGRLSLNAERRKRAARLFSRSPLRYEVVCNLLWARLDSGIVAEQRGLEAQLGDLGPAGAGPGRYLRSGPEFSYASRAELYDDLARVWANGSLQMHRLCRANGIRYFHFLQPNQYFRGSKPLSPWEQSEAFQEDHPYRPGVEAGYPLLLGRGARLRDDGVAFHDLTGLFARDVETRYADSCCHLNEQGYDLVARAIGEAIREDYRRHP